MQKNSTFLSYAVCCREYRVILGFVNGDPGICVMSYTLNSKRTTRPDVMSTDEPLICPFLFSSSASSSYSHSAPLPVPIQPQTNFLRFSLIPRQRVITVAQNQCNMINATQSNLLQLMQCNQLLKQNGTECNVLTEYIHLSLKKITLTPKICCIVYRSQVLHFFDFLQQF